MVVAWLRFWLREYLYANSATLQDQAIEVQAGLLGCAAGVYDQAFPKEEESLLLGQHQGIFRGKLSVQQDLMISCQEFLPEEAGGYVFSLSGGEQACKQFFHHEKVVCK